MPFDREGTLRKAEKLLRQGKLDLAIAEYRNVVDDQPADLNTANTLGDLYIRAGQIDKAVAEYARIADHFANEGFFPKAVALYKKILKINPDDERALWLLAGISARQGLMADARTALVALAERRRVKGDRRGEAEARVKLGDLDGIDLDTRLAGARARVALGDVPGAVAKLKEVAAELQERGKGEDALKLLTEAAGLSPDDRDLNRLLLHTYAARGDFDNARQYAHGAAEMHEVAEELLRQGRDDQAVSVLTAAVEMDPSAAGLSAQLAKLLLARFDTAAARRLLTPEMAGADPELLWALAEMELRDGNISGGASLLERTLAADPGRRDALVILGCSVAEVNPDAGYECIEVAARSAIAGDEWAAAAAALNEFVSRVPNHIPALMRLVEICVDGGLEATMYSAQAQLADAYLVTGAGAEARVIAEDLVAREPWERANIERFRRALTMLGEPDVDAIIAERLSGQSPFTSTDFLWSADPAEAGGADSAAGQPQSPERAAPSQPAAMPAAPDAFAVGPESIDLQAILEEAEPLAPPTRVEVPEVDLSDVLQDLRKGGLAPAAEAKPAQAIEDVLQGIREEAASDPSPESAEQHLTLAHTYLEMGMHQEAVTAFQVAARSPRHRFRAARALGDFYLEGGDRARAIEWFELAAGAPASDPSQVHALLYDLASTLEAHGESARALAVFLELQAEAGDYRDLASKFEHLMMDLEGKE